MTLEESLKMNEYVFLVIQFLTFTHGRFKVSTVIRLTRIEMGNALLKGRLMALPGAGTTLFQTFRDVSGEKSQSS